MSFLGVFFLCLFIIVILEPKVIGSILYWLGLLAIGFVGFWALMFWALE